MYVITLHIYKDVNGKTLHFLQCKMC